MTSIKIAFVLLLFVAAAAVAASAQTQVFVSGTASGCFGSGGVEVCTPMVASVTVKGPATITVTYVSGTVIWDGVGDTAGPDGVDCDWCEGQTSLEEGHGIVLQKKTRIAALIGVFVPQARAAHKGFSPIDGTKDAVQVGIMPGWLFFIGQSKTFDVKEAGTLFLGINDTGVGDNSGGFNVEVTGP